MAEIYSLTMYALYRVLNCLTIYGNCISSSYCAAFQIQYMKNWFQLTIENKNYFSHISNDEVEFNSGKKS